MPRPRKMWRISGAPREIYFKPRSIPLSMLEEATLTLDELEALRLSDLEGRSQTEAAEMMQVHQSTFQRTLARARKKVADAMINAKAIRIEGGAYTMPGGDRTGPIGGGMGRGRGACAGFGRGIGAVDGKCRCPKCGYEEPHTRGTPCTEKKCPKCSERMLRA